MTALETLRALKWATAEDVAAQSGIALEYVYLELVAAESAGTVALRRQHRRFGAPGWQWVAL